MKTLGSVVLAVVSLLTFLSANAETAGVPMMYEIRPERSANQVLARLVEQALKRDSSGNGRIEGSPCTTPNDFVQAIRAYHPGAKLNGAQELPGYLRALVFREAPSGTFRMSRMLLGARSGGKTSCTLDTEGWSRPFKDGEGSWQDANTGHVVLAGTCSNVVEDRPPTAATPPPPQPIAVLAPPVVTQGGCPEVYTLKVNVWPATALKFPGVEQAIAAAESSKDDEGFRDKSRLSRRLGGALRAEAARNPVFQRSATARLFRMSLIKVDQNDRVVAEQAFGDYFVTGLREFKFTRAQLTWDAIRIIDLRAEMLSPVFHSATSLREIRFYNTPVYKGLPMGEWSVNRDEDCVMNVHAIEAQEQ